MSNGNNCVQCNSANFIMDKIQGEVVCSDCGLVLKEDILSYKPEWRAHTLAEYKNKTRTGIPIRYSKYDKGLSTSISGFRDSAGNSLSSKTKRKIWRLRKWQLRARDSKTGNLLKAMNKLQLLTENLHVSNTVQEKAAIIYRKALEKNLIQGRTIAGLVAGSMYVACRFTKTPKTINDIVKASNLSRRKISRAYRLIIQKLKIKMPPHDPLGYISRVAENTNISGEIQGISIRLLHQARHQRITLGKDPLGLVAALLYIACQLKNDPTTQKDIAEAAGITEVTLRNRKKDLVTKLGLKNIGSK